MTPDAGHYYYPDGKPAHFVECKTREGTRPTTIADARKLGLYPSVTQILRCLAKPQLTDWLIRTAVTAAVTTPRQEGEGLDAFVDRVLARDAQDESTKAKDMGSEIHAAIEEAIAGRLVAPVYKPYVDAALEAMKPLGGVVCSEKVLVHPLGFAGRTDAILQGQNISVLDFKTGKKLPTKSAWPEHRLQVAAYAASLGNTGEQRIQTAVLYISTVEPGKVALFTQLDWVEDWSVFQSVFRCWCYLNSYQPKPV